MRSISRKSAPIQLGLLVCLAATAPAGAQDIEGQGAGESRRSSIRAYVEYATGLSIVRNQNLTGADATAAGLAGRIRTDPGFNVGAAAGVRWDDFLIDAIALRSDIEIAYRRNAAQQIHVGDFPRGGQGDLRLLTAMWNVYGELDLDLGVMPYAGIGIGYGRIEIDAGSRDNTLEVLSEESVFAWSLMAGVTLPVSDVTHFSLGYRYLATTDPKYDAQVGGVGTRWVDSEYDAHEARIAVRFFF